MKQKWCNQSKLNLSIDIIMLLLLMPLAGIGFLIKYVLIPGIQRNERYGAGVELEFWGLTRHQWGSIHLIISIVFLVLLLFHIILHWKMIVGIFKRMIPDKALRAISATLIASAGLLMIAFPLFVKPEIVTRESLHLNRKIKQETHQTVPLGEIRKEVSKGAEKDIVVSPRVGLNKPEQTLSETVFVDLEINGRQTLQFVANKYGIPVEKLATDLNIPLDRAGEKLGRLRKLYVFTMNDVRKSILKNKE
ncbi:MAG: DUF4405 domain-containing protein [Proteiniphilum sp.]|nr:DUF4405 domain-containing protein [Proteiniphilum sp.]